MKSKFLSRIRNRLIMYNPRLGVIALRGIDYNYGEKLYAYPFPIAIKMLLARLALILPLSILLPRRRLLINHHGTKMYVEFLNHGITPFDIILGVYEWRIVKLLSDLVKEGMTILDIGSWEGDYSCLFAHWMNDTGQVIAFEPEPNTRMWLRKNIEVNNYKCIDVCEYALSDREGTSTFYPGAGVGSLVFNPFWHSEQIESITVKTQSLDNFLNQINVDKVDIIKIDVEGSDLLVLKGAEHTLRNNHVHLIMDVDVVRNEDRKELYDLLTSFGYKMYRIGKRLIPIKRVNELYVFPDKFDDSPGVHVTYSKLLVIKNRIKSIIPDKLLPIINFVYGRFAQRKKSFIRQIYAVKIP